MKHILEKNEEPEFRLHESACPYNGVTICRASISSMAISNRNSRYCGSEDYDNCPLFLSKILRGR